MRNHRKHAMKTSQGTNGSKQAMVSCPVVYKRLWQLNYGYN